MKKSTSPARVPACASLRSHSKDEVYHGLLTTMQEQNTQLPFLVECDVRFGSSPCTLASPIEHELNNRQMGEVVLQLHPKAETLHRETDHVLVLALDMSRQDVSSETYACHMTRLVDNIKIFLMNLIQHRHENPLDRYFLSIFVVHEGETVDIFGFGYLDHPTISFREFCPRAWTPASIVEVHTYPSISFTIVLHDSAQTRIPNVDGKRLFSHIPTPSNAAPSGSFRLPHHEATYTTNDDQLDSLLGFVVGDLVFFAHMDLTDHLETLRRIMNRLHSMNDTAIECCVHREIAVSAASAAFEIETTELDDHGSDSVLDFLVDAEKTQRAQNLKTAVTMANSRVHAVVDCFHESSERSVIFISNAAHEMEEMSAQNVDGAIARADIKKKLVRTVLCNRNCAWNAQNCHVYWITHGLLFDAAYLSQVAHHTMFYRFTLLACDNLAYMHTNFTKIFVEVTTSVAWNVVVVVESKRDLNPQAVCLKDTDAFKEFLGDKISRRHGAESKYFNPIEYLTRLPSNPFESPAHLIASDSGEWRRMAFQHRLALGTRTTFTVCSSQPEDFSVRVYLDPTFSRSSSASFLRTDAPPVALILQPRMCLIPQFSLKMDVFYLLRSAAKCLLYWQPVLDTFFESSPLLESIAEIRNGCKRVFAQLIDLAKKLPRSRKTEVMFLTGLMDDIVTMYFATEKECVDKTVVFIRLLQTTQPARHIGNFGQSLVKHVVQLRTLDLDCDTAEKGVKRMCLRGTEHEEKSGSAVCWDVMGHHEPDLPRVWTVDDDMEYYFINPPRNAFNESLADIFHGTTKVMAQRYFRMYKLFPKQSVCA